MTSLLDSSDRTSLSRCRTPAKVLIVEIRQSIQLGVHQRAKLAGSGRVIAGRLHSRLRTQGLQPSSLLLVEHEQLINPPCCMVVDQAQQ